MVTKEKLEGKEPQVEGAEPTPEQEGAEPTKPEGDTTVGKTYTEAEFRKELDKALGKGLESTNRQLSLRKKETDAAKAELEEYKATTTAQLDDLRADLEDRIREHEEALKAVDDETIRKSYTDRVALNKKERGTARREKDAEAKLLKAEKLVFEAGLEKLADSKVKELKELGYDTKDLVKALEDCKNEYEIENTALRYQLTRTPKKVEPQKEEEETPKFDSGRSGSGSSEISAEWAEKASMEDYIARRKKQDPNIL